MGFMDKILKGKGDDGLLPDQPGGDQPADDLASVQAMYGLQEDPGAAVADGTSAAQQPAPAAASPPAESAEAQAPAPSETPQPAPSDEGDDALASPLRDLFTEASSMDPQLKQLLERVEQINAQEIYADLQDFVKTIGADKTEAASGSAPPDVKEE